MTVSGVNNSNNNAGTYAAGAAVVGGGAAGAYGYFSRPFLKDGAPTDAFVKNVKTKWLETAPAEQKALYEETVKFIDDIEKAKNVDELKNLIRNNSLYKAQGDEYIEALIKEVDNVGFDVAKANLKKGMSMGINFSDDIIKDMVAGCWDKNAKKFVHNADEITKEGFDAVKSAAKKIQLKTAGIYGGIAAAVLGLGTYLCCAGKKAPQVAPEQNIDTQA